MAKTTVLALVLFSVVCAQAWEIPAISSVAEKELSKPLNSPLLQKDAENCPTNGIFPIPGDCTAYIICRNGRERKRQCPKGFFFDSVMFCTPDDTADCGFPPTPSQMKPLDDFCPRMYGIFADPDNCRQYVVCHEGRGIVHKCPEGTVYVSYAGCLKGNTCPTPDKLETDMSKETLDRSVCNLPPDSGPCQGDFPRFYYNSATNRCEGFTYGGCQGNGNNFKTKRKCKRTCFRRNDNKRLYESEGPEEGDMEDNLKTLDEVIDTVDTMRQVIDEQNVNNRKTSDERMCYLSYQSGPCYGYFPRYYYDSESKTCKKFTYGGCGGNENNFKTLDECKHRCARELETEDEDYKEFRCRKTGRFANPNNCDSYIECYVSSGQVDMELVQCPNYQHYNMETKQCDDKCNAQCDQTLACTCEWPHCYTDCAPHPDFLCPGDGKYFYLGDCSSYHVCKDGKASKRVCPKGLHFSKDTNRCEMPCNAKCDQNLDGECGWSSSYEDSLDDESVTEVSPQFKCIDNGFYPNPNDDCSKFVHCSNGKPYEMHCAKGLHFSSKHQRCLPPCEANCDQNIPCFMQERLCDMNKCFHCPTEDGEFSDLYDCSIYHDCKGGRSTIQACPAGKLFDHRTIQCVRKEKALCVYQCEKLNSVNTHPQDVNSFIQCENGRSTVKKCPDGKVFRHKTGQCEDFNSERNGLLDIFQTHEFGW